MKNVKRCNFYMRLNTVLNSIGKHLNCLKSYTFFFFKLTKNQSLGFYEHKIRKQKTFCHNFNINYFLTRSVFISTTYKEKVVT